jgi:hypothetical protein
LGAGARPAHRRRPGAAAPADGWRSSKRARGSAVAAAPSAGTIDTQLLSAGTAAGARAAAAAAAAPFGSGPSASPLRQNSGDAAAAATAATVAALAQQQHQQQQQHHHHHQQQQAALQAAALVQVQQQAAAAFQPQPGSTSPQHTFLFAVPGSPQQLVQPSVAQVAQVCTAAAALPPGLPCCSHRLLLRCSRRLGLLSCCRAAAHAYHAPPSTAAAATTTALAATTAAATMQAALLEAEVARLKKELEERRLAGRLADSELARAREAAAAADRRAADVDADAQRYKVRGSCVPRPRLHPATAGCSYADIWGAAHPRPSTPLQTLGVGPQPPVGCSRCRRRLSRPRRPRRSATQAI